jgi:hypothetical protein
VAENSADNKPQESADEELLRIARERFKLAAEAEASIREQHLDDLKFRAGDQWPAEVLKEREEDQRPCHVVNRIPQFVRQITNDQRQNRPSIRVHPVDDQADIETAKTIRGLIRHIEYNSSADVAYDTAFESAVVGGFGYFRIVTDYANPMSFEQEILIKRIKNPLTVYVDPYYKEPDGSDMEWGFITEDLSKDEFKTAYPKSEMAGLEDFESIGDRRADWLPEEKVRVAEYYYKEYKEEEIVLLSDNTVVLASEFKKPNILKMILGVGLTEKGRRMAKIPSVKWCKINAVEVLERREILGHWIPIIPVLGAELDVDGQRILESVVRHAKDSQRQLNYMKSAQSEAIALAPRAPFIGYEGQFQGHESSWRTAHKKNHAFLQVKPVSLNGQAAPLPQRSVAEPAIQAISMASAGAEEDLKATTGIYDASLGGRSNETSGVAIARRNQQAQTSNFHFVDNLTRSLRHAGRILVQWIPHIYDTARTARIIGEDDQPQLVQLNQPFKEGGEMKIYDMSVGQYDVVVDVGPSYATKRQEAADMILELSTRVPNLMQIAGDLLMKNMDIPGNMDLAERFKKTLAPELIDDKDKPKLPPQAQAQLQQSAQLIEVLTKQLNEAKDLLSTKQLELESKERIEMAKLETQVRLKAAELDAADARLILEKQIAEIQNRQQYLREDQMIGAPGQPIEELAQPEMAGAMPTGGQSPGNPMEGMP